jgi:hypothetical protein
MTIKTSHPLLIDVTTCEENNEKNKIALVEHISKKYDF